MHLGYTKTSQWNTFLVSYKLNNLMLKLSLVIFLSFCDPGASYLRKCVVLASMVPAPCWVTGLVSTPEVACTKRFLRKLTLPSTATGCCKCCGRTCRGKQSLRYTINYLETLLPFTQESGKTKVVSGRASVSRSQDEET